MSLSGFPGYGFMPVHGGERHASPACFADFGAATQGHIAGQLTGTVPRSETSPLPISTSPLRDHFAQRTTGIVF